MGFFDDVNDAMGRDTGLRTLANVGRQAMGDTSWRGRQSTVDEADAKVYDSQPARGVSSPQQSATQLSSDIDKKYFQPTQDSGRPLPSFDAGQSLRGKQIYNYYDPDHPVDQEKNAKATWADMARQLATFSALRQMGNGPVSTGNTHMDLENLNHFNDMQKQRFMADHGLQVEGVRGQNQLANTSLGYGLQGKNQEAHDSRAYDQAMALKDAELTANAGLRGSQQDYYQEGADLRRGQKEALSRAEKEGKDPHALARNYFSDMMKANPPTTMEDMIRMWTMAQTFSNPESMSGLIQGFKNRKAEGGLVGYADGGQVETPEQVMARIQAKYGVSGQAVPQPQVQAPAPRPQPQPQQQPQQPQGGLMDRMRAIATGNLDRRMQGYADGGQISVGGRQVLGPGTGKSDSIPAVIDGDQPAALSTGEFVMPVEAVQYHGLDRLNKMVAQARKGLDSPKRNA